MNIEVRYFSRLGSNQKLAEEITQELISQGFQNTTCKDLQQPFDTKVDVLFLGGAVYFWRLDKHIRKFISTLPVDKIGLLAAFGKSGNSNSPQKILKRVKKKQIPTSDKTLLFITPNKNNHRAERIKEFISSVMTNLNQSVETNQPQTTTPNEN